MKCLLIVNPASGQQQFQRNINLLIGDLILKTPINTIDVHLTTIEYNAKVRASEIKEGQYALVICLGGDGTVNECFAGVIASGVRVPIAVLPAGTVNDFATYLGLPKNYDELINLINTFHVEDIDVGQVGDHVFANVVSGGMFSDIAFQVSTVDKNTFGPLAYYTTALTQLPAQLSIDLHLTITTDSMTLNEEAALFMVTNTSHVGGFEGITPHANVKDGLLDLIIIRKTNVGDLIAILMDYALNKHLDNPNIEYLQTRSLTIECPEKILYDIDGEAGEEFPIHIECLPGAISLLTFPSEQQA